MEIESRKNVLHKRRIVANADDEIRPSGLKNDAVIDWDQFIAAWQMDRAPGSMSPQLLQALETFILQWRLEGRGGFRTSITVRNPRCPEQIEEIDVHTDKMPDITYNPDGVRDIRLIQMPYGKWMEAVGDLKVNLAGSSYGEEFGKYEHLHIGGPVDVSRDVRAVSLDPDDPMSQILE